MADRLGMSKQTVHRVMQQLEAHGLIVRDPSRDRFAIGPRFSKLALDAMQSANKGAPIRATIQKVVDDIGETCNVSPSDCPGYRVFIQSTSHNRKLIAGTKFLYEVEDWEEEPAMA